MPVIELHGRPTFQGEVQLASWSETDSAGMTIRLRLNGLEEGTGHPFKGLGTGKSGQKFMAVIVPVDDIEEEKPVEKAPPVKTKWQDKAPGSQIAIRCASQEFREWMINSGLFPDYNIQGEDSAAVAIKDRLGILTRANMDPLAVAGWDQLDSEYQYWAHSKRMEDHLR